MSVELCGMLKTSINLVPLFDRLGLFSVRMINPQDVDLLPLDTIRNDIRHAVKDGFPCIPHPAFLTHLGMMLQPGHRDAIRLRALDKGIITQDRPAGG